MFRLAHILRLLCIKIRNYFIKCKKKKLTRLDLNVNQIRTAQATIAALQVYAQVGLYNHYGKYSFETIFLVSNVGGKCASVIDCSNRNCVSGACAGTDRFSSK